MDHNEELARLRAEMDQAVEGMRDLARAVRGFYESLQEEGFTEPDAMRLTAAWLTAIATPPARSSDD